MNRLLMLPLAASIVALATAAPVGALSGYGISAQLSAPSVSTVGKAKTDTKTHTCQAGHTKEAAGARSTIVGTARKTAVVACEQPPRSQLLGPALRHAAASVLAALG
jgi:hypothetical protein